MDDFKVFEAKSLDQAISEACAYFATEREKLEIDIIHDAKSGIFGLVGGRKAKVKARRFVLNAQSEGVKDIFSPKSGGDKRGRKQERQEPKAEAGRSEYKNARPEPRHEPARQEAVRSEPREPVHQEPRQDAVRQESSRQEVREPRPEKSREQRPERPKAKPKRPVREEKRKVAEFDGERMPLVPLTSLDQTKLCAVVEETCRRLITPIIGEIKFSLEVQEDRVDVHIQSEAELGLLIGREGQTLSSLQYLASRIVANHMQSAVRVLIDAGDYRERQDEKLRELALNLAERAKTTGKVCPTRPLSSYQRRVVHMALHDDAGVQTRSSGEGTLKRVIIQRRREPAAAQ